MTDREQKFLDKNLDNLRKLDKFVAENKDKIKLLITSLEVVAYLKGVKLIQDEHDNLMLYNGVRIISDPYFGVKSINVVYKESDFRLSLPCNCGIYDDEPHDRLR